MRKREKRGIRGNQGRQTQAGKDQETKSQDPEKKLAAIEADISETEALLLDIEQEMEQHAADYVRLENCCPRKTAFQQDWKSCTENGWKPIS